MLSNVEFWHHLMFTQESHKFMRQRDLIFVEKRLPVLFIMEKVDSPVVGQLEKRKGCWSRIINKAMKKIPFGMRE